MHRTTSARALGVLLALAGLLTLAPAATAQVELLTTADLPAVALTVDQNRFLGNLLANPAIGEVRLARLAIDPAVVDGAASLTLFPGETLTFSETRVERRSGADYSWFGTEPGRARQAILVVNGEHVTGSAQDGRDSYAIRPLGDGLIAVARFDQTALPPEHPPEFAEVAAAAGPQVEVGAAAGCSYVDLIVAYTNDAGSAVADIYGLVQLAVAETNQSYANSGVVHDVRMVHFYGTNYNDSGNMSTDLSRFRTNGDGYMDEVHSLRDAFDADVAMLITDAGSYCGIASTIYASSSTAFALTAQNCATGYYSFGHEIGHLHGARHNTQADSSTWPFPYGHGYYYTPADWRTVMSYNCPGGCTRLPYWSNPYVYYGGVPMGTTSTNDNARVLNGTCSYIAGFR